MNHPRPPAPRARGGAHRRRVAIVEDHVLQRSRTEQLVRQQPDLAITWSGEDLPSLIRWLGSAPQPAWPHLVVLDLMVERGPQVAPEQVRTLIRNDIRVLVLSAMASPEQVRKVIQAGIGGIVGKRDSEQDFLRALRTVLDGGHWMTPELASVIATDADRPALSDQEERALILYASGLTLNSVAQALGVQPATAKKYLDRVKVKYAAVGRPVHSKVDLNRAARLDGLLGADEQPG
ncbi:response regulator transcription factor [Nocardioides sp. AE5]|uniref:response regulator transcription factor n=1 Tax=Nocardioides sp. AE5 TaxID=2962573 RepID=UPI002882CD54|nr:response regulator transcription factor [Nocardioides sp. AE5]MDT0203422.1 response regulator transcription factor [Nocardioides sp. AE5]